jgi:hypothetical protein
MGVFDEARDKAEEMIGNLTGDDEQRDREAVEAQEAEKEKAEILEEAQDAADRAREH